MIGSMRLEDPLYGRVGSARIWSGETLITARLAPSATMEITSTAYRRLQGRNRRASSKSMPTKASRLMGVGWCSHRRRTSPPDQHARTVSPTALATKEDHHQRGDERHTESRAETEGRHQRGHEGEAREQADHRHLEAEDRDRPGGAPESSREKEGESRGDQQPPPAASSRIAKSTFRGCPAPRPPGDPPTMQKPGPGLRPDRSTAPLRFRRPPPRGGPTLAPSASLTSPPTATASPDHLRIRPEFEIGAKDDHVSRDGLIHR